LDLRHGLAYRVHCGLVRSEGGERSRPGGRCLQLFDESTEFFGVSWTEPLKLDAEQPAALAAMAHRSHDAETKLTAAQIHLQELGWVELADAIGPDETAAEAEIEERPGELWEGNRPPNGDGATLSVTPGLSPADDRNAVHISPQALKPVNRRLGLYRRRLQLDQGRGKDLRPMDFHCRVCREDLRVDGPRDGLQAVEEVERGGVEELVRNAEDAACMYRA
jgi:hypothetical protein